MDYTADNGAYIEAEDPQEENPYKVRGMTEIAVQ
jgi:hypothetical protein